MHILQLAFRSSANDGDIQGCLQVLNRMREMDSVGFAVGGRSMGRAEGEFLHASAFAVKDFGTFRDEYARDPLHREVDFAVMPFVPEPGGHRVSDDLNPDLGSMLEETQVNRAKADSELEEHFRELPNVPLDDMG